jgi:hypothetical protein
VKFQVVRFRTFLGYEREEACLAFPMGSFRPFLDAFAKLRKGTVSFVMSVRPYRTTLLPLDGFS